MSVISRSGVTSRVKSVLAEFLGVGSQCAGDQDRDGFDDACPRLVPTVSEWGIVVLTLFLMVGSKLRFGFLNRRQAGAR